MEDSRETSICTCGHVHSASSLPFPPTGQPGDACLHTFIFVSTNVL